MYTLQKQGARGKHTFTLACKLLMLVASRSFTEKMWNVVKIFMYDYATHGKMSSNISIVQVSYT